MSFLIGLVFAIVDSTKLYGYNKLFAFKSFLFWSLVLTGHTTDNERKAMTKTVE